MMDRSANMRAIRSKDTKPELAVRRLVHRMGYRYRLHVKDLAGKPDLVFSKKRKIIFVHGCFWHQHHGCKTSHIPKSRLEYWITKLEKNVKRDQDHRTSLQSLGWDILVVWECEVKNTEALKQRLKDFLDG